MKNNESLYEKREETLKTIKPYYRYQPLLKEENCRLNSLSKEKLWVSDPKNFNDPLDLNLAIRDLLYRNPILKSTFKKAVEVVFRDILDEKNKFFDEDILNSLKLWLDEIDPIENVIQAINRRINKCGVICLTQSPSNPLMWSHYATNHCGFAIEYTFHHLNLQADNSDYLTEHVKYTSELPEMCISEFLFSPHQVIERYLTTKSVEWAYENEFRLINLNEKGKSLPMLKNMELTALIGGANMDAKSLEKLQITATRLNVPCFKVISKNYKLTLNKEF